MRIIQSSVVDPVPDPDPDLNKFVANLFFWDFLNEYMPKKYIHGPKS
jgi:hypothetical protein